MGRTALSMSTGDINVNGAARKHQLLLHGNRQFDGSLADGSEIAGNKFVGLLILFLIGGIGE